MLLEAISAGIMGTALMTSVLYVIAYFTKDRFKVVKVLGTMLTFQTTAEKGLSDKPSAITVGILAHYCVGIGFAFIYHWLWSEEIVNETYLNATWLGFVNGVVAVIGWRTFIAIHPNPPHLPIREYLIAILLGHIFLAYGILGTYLIFN